MHIATQLLSIVSTGLFCQWFAWRMAHRQFVQARFSLPTPQSAHTYGDGSGGILGQQTDPARGRPADKVDGNSPPLVEISADPA